MEVCRCTEMLIDIIAQQPDHLGAVKAELH